MKIELTSSILQYTILIFMCAFGWIKVALSKNDIEGVVYFVPSVILTLLLIIFIVMGLLL